MDYKKIVQEIIEQNHISGIELFCGKDEAGISNYLKNLEESYIRTVQDLNCFVQKGKKILEIGSFFGVVSIALKKCGYSVYAFDIPEFFSSLPLKKLYEDNGVPFTGFNLRKGPLPYESNSFDCVIICEVLEHLNFNPLPVLLEINRVLKEGGIIYIGMPNLASVYRRMGLLFGHSIHNPIDDFFKQLDRNSNMIVGIHWREYTMSETINMIEKMGFTVEKKYFFGRIEAKNFIKKMVASFIEKFSPSLKPFQVVVGKKISNPSFDFWFTDANL